MKAFAGPAFFVKGQGAAGGQLPGEHPGGQGVIVKGPDAAEAEGFTLGQQLSRRIAFKKAMKQSIQRAMRAGAKGIKVSRRMERMQIIWVVVFTLPSQLAATTIF